MGNREGLLALIDQIEKRCDKLKSKLEAEECTLKMWTGLLTQYDEDDKWDNSPQIRRVRNGN